jgi:nucleoside-diphosphate-sugar epimerase
MKVHVTGAGGFIGTALRSVLTDAVSLEDAQAVVHLAGIAHRHATREELQRVNVELAVETARRAAARGAAFVFMSTAKVHGEESSAPFTEESGLFPEDLYAQSKARAEDALRAIPGLKLAILRPPLVYGPGVKANFLALMQAIDRGIPLPLASIRNRRSFVYVGNLADAIMRCLGTEGTYLIADGPALSTPDLCIAIGKSLGRAARLFPFPFVPGKLSRSLEVNDSRLRAFWTPPFSLEQGLSRAAAWYRGR